MLPDNKGFFEDVAHDDAETCDICNTEMLLFVKDLLDEIQTLRKDVVRLRKEVNGMVSQGDEPYSFPVSDLPGMGAIYLDHPIMDRYEELFGIYVPEY